MSSKGKKEEERAAWNALWTTTGGRSLDETCVVEADAY